MDRKNRRLNVNMGLAMRVLRDKNSRLFYYYIHLKSVCDGYITADRETRKELAEVFGTCTRTVGRNLDNLEEIGWISKDENSEHGYYVRGWSFLLSRYDINCTAVRKIDVVWSLRSPEQFKLLLFSLVIGHKHNQSEWAVCKKRQAKQTHTLDPITGEEQCNADCFSLRFMAEMLNRHHSTIHRYKKDAQSRNYISFSSQKFRLENNVDVAAVRKYNRNIGFKTFRDSDGAYVRMADEVSHEFEFKHRQQRKDVTEADSQDSSSSGSGSSDECRELQALKVRAQRRGETL